LNDHDPAGAVRHPPDLFVPAVFDPRLHRERSHAAGL